ncbi:advillin-like isoform X2 [Babylonia areolata]|uniref:advillin-like isoform X2 n=1 Tax=Babylonia areolata TaxID=304850 RepID=UPI003FD6A331
MGDVNVHTESTGGGGAGAKTRGKQSGMQGCMPASVSDVSRVPSGVTSSYKRSVVSATSGYHSSVTSSGIPVGLHTARLWTATSRGTINDTMTSTNSVISNGDVSGAEHDPFHYVSADRPGLHAWRTEAGRVVTVESNDHGFFHEGACYLVLKVNSDQSTSLHCWNGQYACQHDKRAVERMSRVVDGILHTATVFSAEVQGHESDSFLRNFPEGVVYLEGKPKTTVRHASKYVKRLYVIKGRKFITAACREPRKEEMDSESAALLDGFPRMYLWVGARCDQIRRVKAMQVARRMRNRQRKGKAHIVLVDEKDSQQNCALLKKLTASTTDSSDLKWQDSGQGGPSDASVVNGCTDSLTDTQHEATVNLYRVSGDRVLYDMPFAATCPLQQRFLVSSDSYLLDQGPHYPIMVWIGSKANNTDFSEAIIRGQNFASHRGYPECVSVCRVREGSEPACFKRPFEDWKEKGVCRTQMARAYSVANIGRALFSRSDPRTVGKVAPLADTDLSLTSQGQTETFRVDGESLEPPWDQPGVFLNSDCYVIWHRPHPDDVTQSFPPNILFYWLGSISEDNTQTNCLRLCLTMACALDQALVVRVLDNKEPQSLLSVFDNSMVVYDQDVLSAEREVSLYCVRECAQGSMRVQQVAATCCQLNSSAAFILLTQARCLLWYGKRTGGSEREFSKTMLAFLDSTRTYGYEVVTEGKEPDSFWELLGPKLAYDEHFQHTTLHRRSPQMWLCTGTVSDVTFQDIPDFAQEDLSESDIFILDIFDQVFVWCGQAVEEESRKQLIPLYFLEYMSRDPAGRKEKDVHMWIVSHGSEPEAFRRYFASWDQLGYGGEEAYMLGRKRMRQENARISVDTQMVDKTYVRMTRHPYKALLKAELPSGVLRDHREHHLSDKQFREATQLSRQAFYHLPEWKQAQILKSARLAHFPSLHSAPHHSTLTH